MPKYRKNCLKCGRSLAVPSWKFCQNCHSNSKVISNLPKKKYNMKPIEVEFNWDYNPEIKSKYLKGFSNLKAFETTHLRNTIEENYDNIDIVLVDKLDRVVGYRII
jgi:hypothetical protein